MIIVIVIIVLEQMAYLQDRRETEMRQGIITYPHQKVKIKLGLG